MYTEINKSLKAGNMDDLNLTCPWVYNGSPDTTCLREVEDMEIRLYVQWRSDMHHLRPTAVACLQWRAQSRHAFRPDVSGALMTWNSGFTFGCACTTIETSTAVESSFSRRCIIYSSPNANRGAFSVPFCTKCSALKRICADVKSNSCSRKFWFCVSGSTIFFSSVPHYGGAKGDTARGPCSWGTPLVVVTAGLS